MTVSGVLSSWLTSASRRRRDASFSSSRVLIALNARATDRSSAGPRSASCVPSSPAQPYPRPRSGRRPAQRCRGARPMASTTKRRTRSARKADSASDGYPPNRLVMMSMGKQHDGDHQEDQEATPKRPMKRRRIRRQPHARSGGHGSLLRPPPRTASVCRGPQRRPPATVTILRHRPTGSRRRTPSEGSAGRAASPRSCGEGS